MDGRSEGGRGFLLPKKADGLVARDTDRPRELDCGLIDAPGVKVLAAGFGLNSVALTLNFVEVADAGGCVLLGLETPD